MASLVPDLALRLLTRCETDGTSSFLLGSCLLFLVFFGLSLSSFVGSEEFEERYRYHRDRLFAYYPGQGTAKGHWMDGWIHTGVRLYSGRNPRELHVCGLYLGGECFLFCCSYVSCSPSGVLVFCILVTLGQAFPPPFPWQAGDGIRVFIRGKAYTLLHYITQH